MGSTWEVQAWKVVTPWRTDSEHEFVEVWRGEHWWEAVWNFVKAKRQGYGLVQLRWR